MTTARAGWALLLGAFALASCDNTSAPLTEASRPDFHAAGAPHPDDIPRGNPYPDTPLVWFIAAGNVSASSKGETITIGGIGPFSTQPEQSVGGGGSYTWRDAAGNVVASGQWVARRMISYTSYKVEIWNGSLFVIGGLLVLEADLDNGSSGILRIDCVIGQPPAAAAEGIELALRNGPNFQREVLGGTVFARFP